MEVTKLEQFERAAKQITSVQKLRRAGNEPLERNAEKAPAFKELLRSQLEKHSGVRFSRHVQERIQKRQIDLDAGQVERIAQAMQLAGRKGIRDSLVLLERTAFIVNVPSRTVVTALDQSSSQKVFSNIDGAVIL